MTPTSGRLRDHRLTALFAVVKIRDDSIQCGAPCEFETRIFHSQTVTVKSTRSKGTHSSGKSEKAAGSSCL